MLQTGLGIFGVTPEENKPVKTLSPFLHLLKKVGEVHLFPGSGICFKEGSVAPSSSVSAILRFFIPSLSDHASNHSPKFLLRGGLAKSIFLSKSFPTKSQNLIPEIE